MSRDNLLFDARNALKLDRAAKGSTDGRVADVIPINLGRAAQQGKEFVKDAAENFLRDNTNRTAARVNSKGKTSVGFSHRQAADAPPSAADILEQGSVSADGQSIHVTADIGTTGSSGLALMLRNDSGSIDSLFSYDLLDVLAIQIIDMVIQSGASISTLTRYQLSVLYRYFHRSNPIISQIIDTHTDLLMSKARITPPEGVPEILRDYCVKFTKDWIKKSNFELALRDWHRNSNIFGYAHLVLDDDTAHLDNELQELDKISPNYAQLSEDDEKMVADVEKKYANDPKDVPLKERLEYLKVKCMGRMESDYSGPQRALVYTPLDLNKEYRNMETGFESISVGVSNEALNETDREKLKDLGYTKGWISLIEDAQANNQTDLLIDNNPLGDFPFMAVMERADRVSLIHRVLHDALQYEVGRRAEMVNLLMFGKVGRIYKAPNASPDQLFDLEAQIMEMHADPTYVVVTNFELTVDEVGVRTKDQASELANGQEKSVNMMSTSLGLPMSFISNESQYSGANVTLEVINVIYNSQKDRITHKVNEEVLKSVAMRKGLIILDEWGDPMVVAPQLSFTRMALRDDSVTSNLFNLYNKGSLPVEIIYEIFNLDTSEIERSLRTNAFSLRDPVFNDLIRDIYTQIGANVAQSQEIVDKICESLGIKKVQAPVAPVGDGMGGGGGDFGDMPGLGEGGGLPDAGGAPGGIDVPTDQEDLGTDVPDVPTDNFSPPPT